MKIPKKQLTESQMKYVDANWQKTTREDMAVHLNATLRAVDYYCNEKDYYRRTGPKGLQPQQPKRDWIKGEYSNQSREQHIERILNMPL